MGLMFYIRIILRVYIGVILRLGRKTFWVSRFAGLSLFLERLSNSLLQDGLGTVTLPKRGFHERRPL